MTYIQVNIGRNTKDGPLSDNKWFAFQFIVMDALHDVWAIDPKEHVGVGWWDGVLEDSAHLSVVVPVVTEDALDDLRADLRFAASFFGQDSIVLIVAESELVSP